jgi:hypothetical protein
MIVEEIQEDLTEAEQFWMDYVRFCGGELYNTSLAAGSPYGCSRSEETKLKISLSKTGKKLRPRSPEHSKNISKSKIGHTVSEETKLKRAKSNRGKKRSPETIEKMREAQKKSPETRAKLSEALKAHHERMRLEKEHLADAVMNGKPEYPTISNQFHEE